MRVRKNKQTKLRSKTESLFRGSGE